MSDFSAKLARLQALHQSGRISESVARTLYAELQASGGAMDLEARLLGVMGAPRSDFESDATGVRPHPSPAAPAPSPPAPFEGATGVRPSTLSATPPPTGPEAGVLSAEPASTRPAPPTGHTGDSTGSSRVPARIGAYEVLNVLGEGGMGTVYKARQPHLDRVVAIKTIRDRPTEDLLERFRREAKLGARLDHPAIARVLEFVESGPDAPYLVLEYVEGRPLSELAKEAPLDEDRIAELLEPVCRAISTAHEAGVLHRDLKPANVMLRAGDDSPVVLDFGVARDLGDEGGPTLTGAQIGTLPYMSPEQADDSKRADARSDVYSLGAILFELATGRRPFAATSQEALVRKIFFDDPPRPTDIAPECPLDLEVMALRCLEKDPDHRYQTAEELADELRRFLDGEPILARPVALPVKLWRRAMRRKAMTGLAAAVILTLAVASWAGSRWMEARARVAAEQERVKAEQAKAAKIKEARELVDKARDKALAAIQSFRERRQLSPDQEERLFESVKAARQELRDTMRRAEALVGPSPEFHVRLAESALAFYQLEEAEQEITAGLKLDPKHELLHRLAGKLEILRIILSWTALQLEPPIADKWLQSAEAHFRAAGEYARDLLPLLKVWQPLIQQKREEARVAFNNSPGLDLSSGLCEMTQTALGVFQSETAGGIAEELKIDLNKAPRDLARMMNYALAIKRLRRFEEAEKLLLMAERFYDRPMTRGALATFYTERGKLKEALQWQRRFVEEAPEADDGLVNLGCLLRDLGQTSEAIKVFESALKRNPNTTRALTCLTALLAKSGSRERAQELSARAVGACPWDPIAVSNFRVTLSSTAEKPERLFKLIRERRNESGDPVWDRSLAFLHLIKGEPSRSLDAAKASLKAEPEGIAALWLAARAELELAHFDSALQRLELIERRFPTLLLAVLKLRAEIFFRQDAHAKRLTCYQTMIRMTRQDKEVWTGLIQSYLNVDRIKEARDACDKALLRVGRNPEIRLMEVLVDLSEGALETAWLKAYTLSRERPRAPDVQQALKVASVKIQKQVAELPESAQLGRKLARSGRHKEALAELSKAIDRDACREPETLYTASLAAACVKDHETCVRFGKLALEARPKSLHALSTTAIALARLKRHDEAIPLLQRAVDRRPFDPTGHRNLGMCYFHSGSLARSLGALLRSLDLQRKDPKTVRLIKKVLAGFKTAEEARRAVEQEVKKAHPALNAPTLEILESLMAEREGAG